MPRRINTILSPRRRSLAIIIVLALALGGLTWAFVQWRHDDAAARIPVPPSAVASKAVAEHLASRYELALRQPTSVATVGALCLAYHADMFFDHADRCYQRVGDLAPDEWRWAYYRALIQSERGGGEALVASLRRVVAVAPEFGPAWLRLGDAEFKAQRYEEARHAWQRAHDAVPVDSGDATPRHVVDVPLSAYAALGLARLALVEDRSEQAREILERLTAQTPRFGPALRLLADSYRSLGREAEAERFVYRANRLAAYAPFTDPMIDDLARESRNSTYLLTLASESNLATNAEWSEHLTRRALEFDPANPDVVAKLARILRTVGRNDEALGFFQRYHEMVPGDFLGLAQIGSCLSALGRYAEAESYFRRALAGIDDPQTHYNLGLLLSLTGRIGEAIGEYEKALGRDPMHADARLNLATAHARQGRMDLALRELTRLVDQDPENAVARTNLGVVLIDQGRLDAARVQLEAALVSDPQLEPARQALEAISK